MRDGQIDVAGMVTGVPTAAILDLATTRSVRFISLSDEEIANVLAIDPVMAPYTIPAESYPGQTEPVAAVGMPNILAVHADLEEELVYEIVRALFENIDELIAVHPAATETTVEYSMEALPVPLHPGAARYFEEIGVTVPERLVAAD